MTDARSIKIEFIGIIQTWADENGFATSGHMEAELADLLYEMILDKALSILGDRVP